LALSQSTVAKPPEFNRERGVGYRVLVWWKACRHRAAADLQRLIDDGRGDVPLIRLRYRCSNCSGGSQFTDWVVSNGYNPQPWSPGEP
jgi:hypothetical protein